jgi:hypothetical protein
MLPAIRKTHGALKYMFYPMTASLLLHSHRAPTGILVVVTALNSPLLYNIYCTSPVNLPAQRSLNNSTPPTVIPR